MQIIRSFIAIEIPDEIKNSIADYIDNLKSIAPKLKWVRKNSLHITLKFLGNQPEQKVENVITTLSPMHNFCRPFDITIINTGAFPNQRKPRVIWLGIEPVPREYFFETFNWIEDKLESIGFDKEQRKFSPHLTLARVKFPADFTDLWRYIDENPFKKQTFSVKHVTLVQSKLRPTGAEYRPIQKYPLHPNK
jgi:RNA 2',3'-cyclic 3'-phosphodiesterase